MKTFLKRAILPLSGAAMALATVVGAIAPSISHAQWVANKPIRLVVPFAPGGGADTAARLVANGLGVKLGAPVIVDNKAGASGSIGSELVFKAPPDGYTLLVGTGDTHSIYPHVYTKSRFKAEEFVPVAPVTQISYVLVARPDLPVKNVKELVELSKRQKLSYATWGAGSSGHALTILVAQSTGMPDLLHIPFTGAGPASQAVMGSQVDIMMAPMPIAVASRTRLKVLAVSAEKRSDALSDIPTLKEQGYTVSSEIWIGVLAPPKTPDQVVKTISAHIAEVVKDPEIQSKLRGLGMTPHFLSQPDYATYIANDYKSWGKTIKDAGIKIDE